MTAHLWYSFIMRRANKEIRDRSVIVDLLNTCHVGRLGTNSRDGYPMVKPLNFVYADNRIYFHTAREGEKMGDIRQDNRVCFELDLPIAYAKSDEDPCRAAYRYQSVIIRGRAHIIEDRQEKLSALSSLMKKYQPEGGYGEFPEEKLQMTGIVRIDIEEMTGKEDLGTGQARENA